MFLRSKSASLPVRPGSFIGVSRLAFEFGGPLARFLQVDTCCFVTRRQFVHVCACIDEVCARSIVKGQAVGELLGCGDRALTRELKLVLQMVLVLLGLVELQPRTLPRTACRHPRSRALLSSWYPQDLVLLRQGVKGLHGLLVEIVNLGVRHGVVLVSGA